MKLGEKTVDDIKDSFAVCFGFFLKNLISLKFHWCSDIRQQNKSFNQCLDIK